MSNGAVAKPEFEHNNGILFLDEAIREWINYLIVEYFSELKDAPYDTLPYLGLVDLGIKIEMPSRPPMSACTLVRAPHFRPPNNNQIPRLESEISLTTVSIEKYLQRYGFTSSSLGFQITHPDEGLKFSFFKWEQPIPQEKIQEFASLKGIGVPFQSFCPNIQLCDQVAWNEQARTLVDFGHFHIFDSEIAGVSVTRASDTVLNWGIRFDNASYVSNLAKSRSLLGDDNLNAGFQKRHLDWLSHYPGFKLGSSLFFRKSVSLAYDYMEGLIDGNDLWDNIQGYARECIAALSNNRLLEVMNTPQKYRQT